MRQREKMGFYFQHHVTPLGDFLQERRVPFFYKIAWPV